jgi:hypothetical protein
MGALELTHDMAEGEATATRKDIITLLLALIHFSSRTWGWVDLTSFYRTVLIREFPVLQNEYTCVIRGNPSTVIRFNFHTRGKRGD